MAVAPAAMTQLVDQKAPEGLDLYSRFAFAGALGCSITHGAFTPVDVYVFKPLNATSRLYSSTNIGSIASRPESSSIPQLTTVA